MDGASITVEPFEPKEQGTVLDCGCVVGSEGHIFHEENSLAGVTFGGDPDFLRSLGLDGVATPAWDALTWADIDQPRAELPFHPIGGLSGAISGLEDVVTVPYPAPKINIWGNLRALVKDGWLLAAWGLRPGAVSLRIVPESGPDDEFPPSFTLDDGTAGIITTMPSTFGVVQDPLTPGMPPEGELFMANPNYPRERYSIAVVVINGAVAAFGYEKGGALDPLISGKAVEHIGFAIAQILRQSPRGNGARMGAMRAARAGGARADLLFRKRTPLILDVPD